MKRWMKGFAIAGVILFCAGIGITALAAAVGGVNFVDYHGFNPFRETARRIFQNNGIHGIYTEYSDDYGSNYNMNFHISPQKEMNLVATYENISSLDLDVENGIVNIVENPELNNEIVIYQKEKQASKIECDLSADSSKLSVEYSLYEGYNAEYYTEGIIEIPVGFQFREVNIDAAVSEIHVTSIGADKLSLEANAATIKMDSFTAGYLNAEVQAGKLTAKGEVTGNLEADVEASQITLMLAGKEEDFNYGLEASMGDINIGNSSHSGVAYEKQISHGASKRAEISCAMGQIDVEFY